MVDTHGIARLTAELVHQLSPKSGEEDVDYALSVFGSLLGRSGGVPSLTASLDQAQARGRRLGADPRRIDQVRRRIEQNSDYPYLPAIISTLVELAGTGPRSEQAAASRPILPVVRPLPETVVQPPTATPAREWAPPSPSALRPARPALEVPEPRLVRDALFVLQGVDGALLRWSEEDHTFVLPPSVSVPPAMRTLLLLIAEAGFLHRELRAWLARRRAPDDTAGVVPQALARAVEDECAEYYRLLAVLEAQLQLGEAAEGEEGRGASRPRSEGLTLRRLLVWMQEPILRLRLLTSIVRESEGLRGGALATSLWRFQRHGNPNVQALAGRLLRKASAPLFQMMRRWILEGEIEDDFNEFFIEARPGVPASQLWGSKYRLRLSQLPQFLPRRLASAVLLIGKSVNFLRLCCDDAAWVGGVEEAGEQARRALRSALTRTTLARRAGAGGEEGGGGEEVVAWNPEVLAALGGDDMEAEGGAGGGVAEGTGESKQDAEEVEDVEEGRRVGEGGAGGSEDVPFEGFSWRHAFAREESHFLEAAAEGDWLEEGEGAGGTAGQAVVGSLEVFVDRAAARASARVLYVMRTRFQLGRHLLALKRYLLLGQGDFTASLMAGVGPELDRPAEHLAAHVLLGVLEGAIRSSNAQYDERDVLDRLNIKLLTPSPGDNGWDVFALDYAVDAPLNAVLTPKAMATYRRIFRFLWRVKRVEWTLSATWTRHMTASHTLRKYVRLEGVLLRAHLLRNDMMSFVATLANYVMFEVLETSWRQLQRALERVTDLSSLVAVHEAYLRALLDRALLSGHKARRSVMPTLAALLKLVLRFAQMQEQLFAAALAEAAGDAADPYRAGRLEAVTTRYGRQLERVSAKYRGCMLQLLQKLDREGSELEEFRFLMFRFDYNEYYDRLSTAPEARELLEAARSVSEDEAQATAESEPGWRF